MDYINENKPGMLNDPKQYKNAYDPTRQNGVLYTRYSSDRQTEQSIEGQIRECLQYAEKNNINIVKIYADRAKTGTNDNREEFQQMLRDSKTGAFQYVIVWKIDRFGRNREDIAKNKAILRRNGVSVISAMENIPEGPEGIILEGLLESLAEYYSAELREKTARGMRESAYKCQSNGSNAPLGYIVDKQHKFVIDKAAAKIVNQIFAWYDKTESISEVLRIMQNNGIMTPKGNSYTHSMIRKILTKRAYIGEYNWGDISIPGGMPNIVPNELFERVNQKLKRKYKRRNGAEQKAELFLLTGKVFCGHCGGTMRGDSGTGKSGKRFYYYSCLNKRKKTCSLKNIKRDWLEDEVVKLTVDVVLKPDMIDYIADQVVALHKKELLDKSSLNYLQSHLSEIEKSIGNIMKAIEAGIITPTTGERLRELEAEREELRTAIAKEMIARPAIEKTHVLYFLNSFVGGDVDDAEYRRRLIDTFVNKVLVYEDKIIITYNYSGERNEVTAEIIEQAASEVVSLCSDKLSTGSP